MCVCVCVVVFAVVFVTGKRFIRMVTGLAGNVAQRLGAFSQN